VRSPTEEYKIESPTPGPGRIGKFFKDSGAGKVVGYWLIRAGSVIRNSPNKGQALIGAALQIGGTYASTKYNKDHFSVVSPKKYVVVQSDREIIKDKTSRIFGRQRIDDYQSYIGREYTLHNPHAVPGGALHIVVFAIRAVFG
jgi:hypothetical protein